MSRIVYRKTDVSKDSKLIFGDDKESFQSVTDDDVDSLSLELDVSTSTGNDIDMTVKESNSVISTTGE